MGTDTTATTAVDPAQAVITRYLAKLDEFDLEAVLDCFSDDVDYGHPHVPDELSSSELRLTGKANLRRFMVEVRKQQDSVHHVTAFGRGTIVRGSAPQAQGGNICFAAGTGQNFGRVSSFCTIFEVDDDDRICRYSAHVAPGSYNLQLPG